MPIKVHELAKEFKISTAALKKHLSDMGFQAKSHMSPVPDEIVERIRAKFNEEVAAIKKRENDRRSYQQRVKLAERRLVQTKAKPQEKEKEKEKEKKEEIPVFVEKEIKKKPKKEEGPYKKPYKSKKVPKQDAGPSVIPVPSETAKPTGKLSRKQKEKKRLEQEEREKSKHLKAKVQHMKKGGKKKKFTPTEMEEAEISKNIKKTLAASSQKKKKYKKDERSSKTEEPSKIVINEFTSVSELAKIMDVPATEIIAKFFNMGQMVTMNQRLDRESLEMICDEFDFDVEFEEEYGAEILEEKIENQDVEKKPRAPVVTIMGHVDHGKTSILDYIRKTNVIAGESGGITQHIGAYQIEYKDQKITFLDTPGHEAFTAMRARGANITDIVIIVVAANESVKQQTLEAIDHAKAAGVPMIVAINKIDLKNANLDKTISDLSKHNVYLENYGGDVVWTTCSAITGEGIDDLLEQIVLVSEIEEFEAALEVPAKGVVIESQKDASMGSIATILLQEGTLERGDSIVCGATYGKVRKMEDERGNEIEKLYPSDVAVLYGLTDVPKAGDVLNLVENEKTARQIGTERMHIRHERERYQSKTSLKNLFQKIKDKETSDIKIIVKGDTDGSVEALCDSFQKMSTEEVTVNIIRRSVGGINEADVNLASASDAIIIGFNVRSSSSAQKLADDENVEIKIYQVIYEAIDDLKLAMEGMLKPEITEEFLGSARVKEVFRIKKVGNVAGCYVEKGVITNSGKVRLYRDDILIHEGNLASLKHYADEVKEVKAGSDCGIRIDKFNDIKEGDIIENYQIKEVSRQL
jgi:translation initiation factor IF-2